ncbi:Facilitated trehalose transporter Tret1 [Pseudolycoriella hygida]|uniref:Facilitated trehalose transporter Tret1 n=1 Tax=Pseudolycoriella hygida TaxID=35572 RepID=A0A9Q0SAI9_9DIPT|nr:Facilitated trehalose transporter Tret1 [Pseudolycoriella hygida]
MEQVGNVRYKGRLMSHIEIDNLYVKGFIQAIDSRKPLIEIGSCFSIGAILGNCFFALMAFYVGRKNTMLCLAFPNVAFWLFVIFGRRVYHLYIGRVLAGMTGGGMYVCMPLFVAEIAHHSIRGALGTLMMVICCTGILLGYTAGAFISYENIPYVFIVLPILFLGTFVFFPETPQYLLIKNDSASAEKSLRFYANNRSTSKQNAVLIQTELENIQKFITKEREEKLNRNVFEILLTGAAIKAIAIGLCLTAVSLFSGSFVMVSYAATVFRDSGSDLDPNTCVIIVGVIQVLGVYISSILVDRVGRKILLIVSSCGASLSLAALGTFSYLSTHNINVDKFDWIPLLSFSIYIFITSVGIIPLPFIVLAEIIPQKIRDIGTTICMTSISVFAFITMKLFPPLVNCLGLYSVMYIFCGVCVFGVIFGVFILQETNGKNLNKIDEN